MDVPTQIVRREEFPLTQSFFPFSSPIGWMRPTHIGEDSLLRLPIQILIASRNNLTDTPE